MIVVLTGAGISKESGINTFRDSGGLWEQESIEDVATPGGFRRNPGKVYDFYNRRRRELAATKPNAAHIALARLEAELAEPLLVVTQNVDDLHERAGTKALIHMHGELLKARCQRCGAVMEWLDDLGADSACRVCERRESLRPHIVWFEEIPLQMDEIERGLANCSTFASIGTSGDVYPAAGFVRLAQAEGARTVELNLEPSRGAGNFQEGRYGPATEVVPAWVEEMLSKGSRGGA